MSFQTMYQAGSGESTSLAPAVDFSLSEPLGIVKNKQGFHELHGELQATFGQSFMVMDSRTGEVVYTTQNDLDCSMASRLAVCEEVSARAYPKIIEQVHPMMMLVVPLPKVDSEAPLVAVTMLLNDEVHATGCLEIAARRFGFSLSDGMNWSRGRAVWHPKTVMMVCSAIIKSIEAKQSLEGLESNLKAVTGKLEIKLKEQSLIHRLTSSLSLRSGDAEYCDLAVQWLREVLPTESIAAVFKESPYASSLDDFSGQTIYSSGHCSLRGEDYFALIGRLGPRVDSEIVALGVDETSSPTWHYNEIQEVISVPICEGGKVFGWLLAINHKKNHTADLQDFSAIDVSLLGSVAGILGIHVGNLTLYQEQAEFSTSVVTALTETIDAKDPYTCGHSSRVAQIAVLLARRLGCTAEDVETLFMAGLLHDIGKIGIDDNVLCKPGKLTKEEYEQVKMHPEYGYRILKDIKPLKNVLSIVLHHHEAWDGTGYPHQMTGQETPLLARITAVADSIDAMSSDRPYRNGMPLEKLETILLSGSGEQWDPDVIKAYFQVREEVAKLILREARPDEWLEASSAE